MSNESFEIIADAAEINRKLDTLQTIPTQHQFLVLVECVRDLTLCYQEMNESLEKIEKALHLNG
jgi:hypothetical protein